MSRPSVYARSIPCTDFSGHGRELYDMEKLKSPVHGPCGVERFICPKIRAQSCQALRAHSLIWPWKQHWRKFLWAIGSTLRVTNRTSDGNREGFEVGFDWGIIELLYEMFGASSRQWEHGPRFHKKMLSYQYRKSHSGDKTVVRSSYLHNGISYTGKMTSLYWIRAMVYCTTHSLWIHDVLHLNLCHKCRCKYVVGKRYIIVMSRHRQPHWYSNLDLIAHSESRASALTNSAKGSDPLARS